MNYKHEILNSKLFAPGTADTIIRERLYPLFSSIKEHKITVVTAGAGFGKSVVVAQAFDFIECDKSWYRLESGDSDPITFLNYIIAGIKKIYPAFGKRINSILNSKAVVSKYNHSLLTILINEIEETIKKDFVIVLDDCHEIFENQEIIALIQFFIEHLPKHIHVVFISRNELPLSLSKFRSRLEMCEINQSDLEFTVDEIIVLFNQMFDVAILEQSIINLHAKTEGWISGLILFCHLAKGKSNDEIEKLLLKIKSNHKIFREYLGENVYESQPEKIRDFLIKTSVFTRIDAEFCNNFLDIDDSEFILNQLEKNHLFTNSLDNTEKIYCYHNLFREFLKSKLDQEKGSRFVNELHYNAATLFEKDCKDEEAIFHYLKSKNYDDVFRLLRDVGYRFFAQGRHAGLSDLLNQIPERYVQDEPWVLALKAKLYNIDSPHLKSIKYSKRAHEIFISRKLHKEAERVLIDIGCTYYYIGDFKKAEEIFIEILERNNVDDYSYLEILGSLVFTTAYFGNFERSDKYYSEALTMLELSDSPTDVERFQLSRIWVKLNYGFRWHFAGDFSKSIVFADSVLDDIEEAGSPPFMILYYHLLSLDQLFLGETEEARNTINNGLIKVHAMGFVGNQEAWLRMTSASIYMIERTYDYARDEIERALELFGTSGSKWGEASSLVIKGIIYEKQGDSENAKNLVYKGLEIVTKTKLPWVEGKLYSLASIDLINQQKFNDAELILNQSEQLLKYSSAEKCFQNIIWAKFYNEKGENGKAVEALLQALELGEKYSYGSWLFFEVDNLSHLFVKIYSIDKFKDYLIKIFSSHWDKLSDEFYALRKNGSKQIKTAVSEIITKMPKAKVPSLRVNCFGEFKVFTGEREIRSSEWKSNKAREIFKFLILSRNKGAVPKDVLLELIWPEQDYEKTVKRLHVALPALRKTLEPDVRRGESSYLIRENDLYRLDFGENGFVDVDIFTKEITNAEKEVVPEKKLVHYLKAESIYTGDFFSEDIYSDWCFEERESLKRKYLQVLSGIISIYDLYHNTKKCIVYAEKYLKVDNYSEEVYQKLIKYYYEMLNIPMAVRTYEKCYEKIVKDLDCPLSDETRRLFDKVNTG